MKGWFVLAGHTLLFGMGWGAVIDYRFRLLSYVCACFSFFGWWVAGDTFALGKIVSAFLFLSCFLDCVVKFSLLLFIILFFGIVGL